MNLVLIGYRGTGKSSVAKELTRLTGMPVVCMDTEIERRVGRTVADWVAEAGWEPFRDLETAVAREAGAQDGVIIDAGGGAVLREENVAALKRNGVFVWLEANVDTIESRLAQATDRPSLTGRQGFLEEIRTVLEERTPIYAAVADRRVKTDGRTPEEIAREILVILGVAPR